MTTENAHTVDRTSWPDGPWDNEPDKTQWIDEATGLDCLIVRNPFGGLCGYVGLPDTHKLYGKDYDHRDVSGYYIDEDGNWQDVHEGIRVHGGLTYAAACQAEGPVCHVPEAGRPDNVWWLGFDCIHAGDLAPGMMGYSPSLFCGDVYRDLDYVKAECQQLASQLAKMS